MTREEAIQILKTQYPHDTAIKEALGMFIPELRENEDERIRKALIDALKVSETIGESKFRIPYPTREECIAYLEKQKEQKPKMTPKWLYRLEFKDSSCGLWYDGTGKWCFESGIGSIAGCKTKTLPMDYDVRYKQDGRDWFSSCSQKEDLMHWYSLEDAKELISKGFVFTRYLATEYHEYEQQTVFIKETALYREEIDIFELFGQKPAEWSEEDKRAIDRACVALRAYSNGDLPEFLPSELLGYADRLQSLRPQPHWKPSEEQMTALSDIITMKRAGNKFAETRLREIYEQLKKL